MYNNNQRAPLAYQTRETDQCWEVIFCYKHKKTDASCFFFCAHIYSFNYCYNITTINNNFKQHTQRKGEDGINGDYGWKTNQRIAKLWIWLYEQVVDNIETTVTLQAAIKIKSTTIYRLHWIEFQPFNDHWMWWHYVLWRCFVWGNKGQIIIAAIFGRRRENMGSWKL